MPRSDTRATMFIGKPKIKQKNSSCQKGTPRNRVARPADAPRRHMRGLLAVLEPSAHPDRQRAATSPPLWHKQSRATQSATRFSVPRLDTRKRKVTPSTPQWASSDESSDEDDDRDRLRVKRSKTRLGSSSMEPMTLNRTLEPDLKRRIRIREPRVSVVEEKTTEHAYQRACRQEGT